MEEKISDETSYS